MAVHNFRARVKEEQKQLASNLDYLDRSPPGPWRRPETEWVGPPRLV